MTEKRVVARSNLTHRVYRDVRAMMLNFDIVRGQRLVAGDLAVQLGVSRTPVNNALSILAKEGFLEFQHNRGYRVQKISHSQIDALFYVLEIYAVGAIGKAIERQTPAKLLELDRRRLDCEAAARAKSGQRYLCDQEFHAFLIEMAGGRIMTEYFRDTFQRIHVQHSIEGLSPQNNRRMAAEHREICDAVRNRDTELARESLTAHLGSLKQHILASLK